MFFAWFKRSQLNRLALEENFVSKQSLGPQLVYIYTDDESLNTWEHKMNIREFMRNKWLIYDECMMNI